MIGVNNYSLYFLVISFIALFLFAVGILCYNKLEINVLNTNRKRFVKGTICIEVYWIVIIVVYAYIILGKSVFFHQENKLSETLIDSIDLDYISSTDVKHTSEWDSFKVHFGSHSENLTIYKDTDKPSDIVVSSDKDKQKTVDIYEVHYELIPKICYLINDEYVLYLSQEDYDKILNQNILLQGK